MRAMTPTPRALLAMLAAGLLASACGNGMTTTGTAPSTEAPYGAWASPLSAARATAGALRLGQIALDGDDVYWLEGRASEGGRNVLVRASAGAPPVDVSPPGFNVRTRVHEYGGAAYVVHRGAIYASNFADQRLYDITPGRPQRPLTPEGYFYAQCVIDPLRPRLVCIREDHTRGDAQPPAAVVAVPLDGAEPSAGVVLAQGADFYSDAALSPDGRRLAWLQWRHPHMPWDGTELYVADLDGRGTPGVPVRVAGGDDESVFQPSWSPDGILYFVSDRTGWWNLYRHHGGVVQALHPLSAEFGRPQWVLGSRTYAFASANRLVVTYTQDGRWRMALLSLEPRRVEPLDLAARAARCRGRRWPRRLVRRRVAHRGPGHRPRLVRGGRGGDRQAVAHRHARARLHLGARGDHLRQRRAGGARVLLPAGQPRLPRPGRHRAAAAGAEPRRADHGHRRRLRSRDPVLDHARLRGGGRELQRQQRLRPSLPPPVERPVGRRRRARRGQRREAPGGRAARPTRRA